MTEVLGDAVLDLTGDLSGLARSLAEAKILTRGAMQDMAGQVRQLETLSSQAGDNLRRQFLGPVSQAFHGTQDAASSLEGTLYELVAASQEVDKAFGDVKMAAAEMALGVGYAYDRLTARMANATITIEAQSRLQAHAIDEVRDAYLELAAAERAAAAAHPEWVAAGLAPFAMGGSRPALMPYSPGAGRELIYGARGIGMPGSKNDPIVVTLEAGSYAGMGPLAAAIAAGAIPSQNVNGPSSTDLGNLTDAVNSLVDAANAPGPLGGSPDPSIMAQAIAMALRTAQRPQLPAPGPNFVWGELAPGHVALPSGPPVHQPLMLPSGEAPFTNQLGSIETMLGHIDSRFPGLQVTLDDIKSVDDQIRDIDAAIAAEGGKGGGRGGPGGPGGPGGAGGTGGGGGAGDAGFLNTLLMGSGFVHNLGVGRFGVPLLGAGVGSLGSFAGLGTEHIAITGVGLLGSLLGAGIGGGLLAGGALGKLGVGGGSDAAVMSSTIADVKTLNTDLTNLSQAQAVYGKNSQQAAQAQQQLNYDMQQFGPLAGKADLAVAQAAQSLNKFWDAQTQAARVSADKILMQVLQLAHDYVPLVGQAAAQNLAIINEDIKPLFAWLEGPNGKAIFLDLEQQFKQQLPTAIDAFTKSTEVFLRIIDLASHYTGGFLKTLDEWANKLNNMSDAQLNNFVGRMVGDFREWEALVKALITDIYLLFHQDVGTASSIVTSLTLMLQKLGDWERSVQGGQQLHTIFEVHKQEILELLRIIPLFFSAVSPIYLSVAPAMTMAFTGILTVVLDLVKALESLPGGAWVVGLLAISAKLFGLGTTFTFIKDAIKGLGAGLDAVAGGANADAIASSRLAGANADVAATATAAAAATKAEAGSLAGLDATGAGGVLMRGGPASSSTIPLAAAETESAGLGASAAALPTTIFGNLKGSLAGMLQKLPGIGEEMAMTLSGPFLATFGGLFAGGIAQSVIPGLKTGLVGTAGGGVAGGALGAALGSVIPGVGTLFGAGLGSAVGATFGPTIQHLLGGLFSDQTGMQYGRQFAKGFSGQFAGLLPTRELQAFHQQIQQAATSFQRAQEPQDTPTTFQAGAGSGRFGPTVVIHPKIDEAQVMADARNLATKTVAEFEAAFNAAPYKTEPAFLTDAIQVLQKLPPQARMSAAQTMVEYAAALQSQGKLPQGSVEKIIMGLEKQFGILTVSAKYYGGQTAAQWGNAMKLDAAQKNLETAVKNTRQDFDLMNVHATTTSDNMLSQLTTTFTDLKGMLKDTTGAAHQEVLANFQALRKDVENEMGALQTKLSVDAAAMKNNLGDNSQEALKLVTTDFNNLAGNIAFAVHQGFVKTEQGSQLMAQALENELKSFGGAHIPFPSAVQWGDWAINPAASSNSNTSGDQPRGRAMGGPVFGPTTYAVGEEGMKEYVIATNPAYHSSNIQYWAQAGHDLGVPGFATGGYIFPWPSGTVSGRIDQGWDANMPQGAPIGPIGRARIQGIMPGSTAGWDGGPYMSWQLLDGPMAGRFVYLAEEIVPDARPGQIVEANQAIAHYGTGAGGTTGIEMGWQGSTFGQTLAQALHEPLTDASGVATPAGDSFHAFMLGLAHGKIVGGGPGGVATMFNPPHVVGSGTITEIVQAAFNKATSAANAKISAEMPTSIGGVGSLGAIPPAVGSVEKQIYDTLIHRGWNKIAIAAAIGNAAQESQLNPGSIGSGGGGLWGFTSGAISLAALEAAANAAHVNWKTDAAFQAAFMAAHYPAYGSLAALNSYRSPEEAALYFMNTFERPYAPLANIPHREQAAAQAYSQGYAKGGIVNAGAFAGGGSVTASSPTIAVFGENGPETAVFIPLSSLHVPWQEPGWPHHLMHQVVGRNAPGGDALDDHLRKLSLYNVEQLAKNIPELERSRQAPEFQKLSELGKKLDSINQSTDAAKDRAQQLSEEARTATGKQYTRLIDQMRKAQEQAHDDAKRAQGVRESMQDIWKKIHDSHLGETLQEVYKVLDTDLNKQISQLAKVVSNENAQEQWLSLIAGLPTGTNLGKLGITPAVLRDIGLPGNLNAGNPFAEDRVLRQEIANVSKEIHDLQIELHNVHGKQRAELIKHLKNLIKEVVGLENALQQNTSATNANTNSSTGTTAFSYNGQNYLASDQGFNLGVGS